MRMEFTKTVLMNLSTEQQGRETQGTDLWTQLEKERVGRIERTAWKHISPYAK